MKKKLLIAIAFISALNAIALNIGTTNIIFSYEDTNLTAEQKIIVSNCVHKVIEPALPFSFFSHFREKTYLKFIVHDYPFKLRMYGAVNFSENTMTLPITKEFSTEILSKIRLQSEYSNAISQLPEFCARLKTQNVSQLSDTEVDDFFLLTESQKKITTSSMNRIYLNNLNDQVFYEVPIVCFRKENVGPNNGSYLWAYVPNSCGRITFHHLELIYYNNRWYISDWHHDF
jgi:hypothetical protein